MKHKRFTDKQIIGVLNEHGAGARVDEVCRRPRLSRHSATVGSLPSSFLPCCPFGCSL